MGIQTGQVNPKQASLHLGIMTSKFCLLLVVFFSYFAAVSVPLVVVHNQFLNAKDDWGGTDVGSLVCLTISFLLLLIVLYFWKGRWRIAPYLFLCVNIGLCVV